ncbi:hypothetical protein [Nocardioides marmoribigeumensis]|uniref:DUF4386 family protein n=1 Tax=Nocardioides marmoribigeumensis TaxID=433649 RepID=A0ABU2C1L0_9ACTN|nr:hypothetical protein [Nocardioides marmoribigeumensis]MDR7364548.1 hypothetical protein [Nocardioides marmoribigeumensis]
MHPTKSAGLALIGYGLLTFVAFGWNAPGGEYDEQTVTRFISSGHMWAAFGWAYLGILGTLCLLVFGLRIRDEVGASRDLVTGLTTIGTATSLVGWFVTGGLAVSAAEGGGPVRDDLAHSVVYTLSEIGNLLAVCSPALCAGIVAIVLARTGRMPRGLGLVSVVAGVCGILAPFYFTYFVFLLWTLVAGTSLAVSRRPAALQRVDQVVAA